MDDAEVEQATAALESPAEPEEEEEETKDVEEYEANVNGLLALGDDIPLRKKYPCTYTGCERSFDWKSYWERHMQTHTGEKPYACTYEGCEYRCSQTGNLKVHMRSHEKAMAKEGVVLQVNTEEVSGVHLQATEESDDGIAPFVDLQPSVEETPKKTRKKRQSKTDGIPKVWTCDHDGCGKQFFWKSYRDRHEQIHTGVKPFVCTWNECYYRTTQSGNLKMHMQKHTGEKPYACTWNDCTYRSTHPGNLKNHMLTHTGAKPYKCKEDGCQYAAAANETLKQHMRTHTGEKPYLCPWDNCSYRSAQAGTLAIHYQTHTGIKPFACGWEGCDYRSSHACHVRKHFLIHTGEKPYKCEIAECTYGAASSDALNRHMRAHRGEKPFKCTLENCDMGFTSAGSLKRHSVVHTGEKPYRCTECDFSASQNETVVRHFKSKHPNIVKKDDTESANGSIAGGSDEPVAESAVEEEEAVIEEEAGPSQTEQPESPEPAPVEKPRNERRKRKLVQKDAGNHQKKVVEAIPPRNIVVRIIHPGSEVPSVTSFVNSLSRQVESSLASTSAAQPSSPASDAVVVEQERIVLLTPAPEVTPVRSSPRRGRSGVQSKAK